jgi:LAO/AO transport system kinase
MTEPSERAAELASGVLNGDRRALARAITLVESERAEDAGLAEELLNQLLPHTGRSRRIGITGPPGAGKSTLIDVLGTRLVADGERVAVLAVDPSSPVGGGSILGDKTRMARLAAAEHAFIRPSPSRGAAGGVGRDTAETVLLCEAAGYSMVLVETLGTGQGEHAVFELVDAVLLVLIPGAGDELQGMKRGAIELADVIAVNKADGAFKAAAERARGELESALGLFARAEGGAPEVLCVSAYEEQGLGELWGALTTVLERSRENGAFERRRAAGLKRSLTDAVERALRAELATPVVAAERDRLEREVLAGRLSARAAATRTLALVRERH